MTNLLFIIIRIYGNQFKHNYLRDKKLILEFLLRFWNLHQISNISKKKTNFIVYEFPKLQTAKDVVR